MFLVTNFFSIVIPLWGMLGLWTQEIGYRRSWEFYFYNIIFGLFQAPYYSVRQRKKKKDEAKIEENKKKETTGETMRKEIARKTHFYFLLYKPLQC
jgi:hypothetical protein